MPPPPIGFLANTPSGNAGEDVRATLRSSGRSAATPDRPPTDMAEDPPTMMDTASV